MRPGQSPPPRMPAWLVALATLACLPATPGCEDTSGGGGSGGDAAGGEGEGEAGVQGRRPEPAGAEAFVLRAVEELPEDRTDFTGARPGDFVLFNSRIIAVVRSAEESLEIPGLYGGGLVDLHARGAVDMLREHIVVAALAAVRPTATEIVDDGLSGGAAVVRVIGESGDLRIIPPDFPLRPPPGLDAAVRTEFSLGPDDDYLDVVTTIEVRSGNPESSPVGDAFFVSDTELPFIHGSGRSGDLVARTPHLVASGIARVSVPPEEGLAIAIDNIIVHVGESVDLIVGRPVSFRRRMYAGDPAAPPAVLGARALAYAGVALGEIRPLADSPDLDVRVKDRAGKVIALGDSSGPFPSPTGVVTVQAGLDGRFDGPEVSVTVVEGEIVDARVSVPAQASLVIKASNQDGTPVPARAVLERDGEERRIVLVPPAGARVSLGAGTVRVLVSRGPEHEGHDRIVPLTAGEETTLDAVVARVVETPGAVGVDTHLHSIWSTDSRISEQDRILACAAEGLEVPVATDHDHITSYRVPEELRPFLFPIVGSEVSTAVYGHFNGFPLTLVPGAPRFGSPSWIDLDPSELFAAIRAAGDDVVITANHATDGGTKGYFSTFGFDEADQPLFDAGFDGVEIMNDPSGDDVDRTLAAMAKLLAAGHRHAFLGVSDSHGLSAWPGHPRTHMLVGEDDPARLTPRMIADAVRNRRTVMTGGPYIEATVGGQPIGSVIDARLGVTVDVRVQAPSWIPVDNVHLVTPGGIVEMREGLPTGAVVRFEGALTLPATSTDSWVYVRSEGSGSMEPYLRGRIVSVTSPFYLDGDGDGAWQP